MPQDIPRAPETFQELMEKAVGYMHLLKVLVHLDDFIVLGGRLRSMKRDSYKS